MVPNDYVGAVMELSQRKRGDFVTMDYLDDYRVNVVYEIPLSEIVFDFFDKLKSSTKVMHHWIMKCPVTVPAS